MQVFSLVWCRVQNVPSSRNFVCPTINIIMKDFKSKNRSSHISKILVLPPSGLTESKTELLVFVSFFMGRQERTVALTQEVNHHNPHGSTLTGGLCDVSEGHQAEEGTSPPHTFHRTSSLSTCEVPKPFAVPHVILCNDSEQQAVPRITLTTLTLGTWLQNR